jgi:hypothetical protein
MRRTSTKRMNASGGGTFPNRQCHWVWDVLLPDQENRMMVRLLLLVRMMVGRLRSRRMMSWRA